MRRRDMLAIAGGSMSVALAGCLGGEENEDEDAPADDDDTTDDTDDQTDDNGEDELTPASFDVSGLDPETASVAVGTTVSVSAEITNSGEESATKAIELRIDGEAVASQDIELAGGASETVTFDVETGDLEAGEYSHGVWTEDGEQSGTLTLQAPASFEVSDLDPETATADVGGTLSVSATVTNTGGLEAAKTVELRLDGEAAASQDLELAGGASETVTFDLETSDFGEGEFEHGVWTEDDEMTGTLTLSVPESPASIEFQDQTINGKTVTIRSVRMDDGGFVVLHDTTVEDAPIESIVQVSAYVEPGRADGLEIDFDEVLTEGETFVAMLHRDTNGNEEFDFESSAGSVDVPYEHEGAAVTAEATLEVDLPPTVSEAVAHANEIIDPLNNDPAGSLSSINDGLENVEDIELIAPVEAETEEEARAEAQRLRDEWERVEEDIFTQVPAEINEQSQEQFGFDLIDEPEEIQTAEDARAEADEVESLSEEAAEALRGSADVADNIEQGLTESANMLDVALVY